MFDSSLAIIILNKYLYGVVFSIILNYLFMHCFMTDLMKTKKITHLIGGNAGNSDNKYLIVYIIPYINMIFAIMIGIIAVTYRLYLLGKIDFDITEIMFKE